MNEPLSDLFGKVQSRIDLKRSIMMPSNETVVWLPLIYFNNGNCVMGLSMQGMWVIETKQGLAQLQEPQSFVRTLALLEEPVSVVKQQIHEKLNSDELSTLVEQIFPITDVVGMGLKKGSDYWANLAIDWFSELSIVQKQQLIDSLDAVSRAKWASQKVRQKANREINRVKKLQIDSTGSSH
jgi:hypothetical protein